MRTVKGNIAYPVTLFVDYCLKTAQLLIYRTLSPSVPFPLRKEEGKYLFKRGEASL